ncbi:MAG: ABC transporter permease [Bdellovibrionota bacterium]
MNFGNIFKIWKKEIKSYFYTPMAYVFLGAFSFVIGIMFLLFLRAVDFYQKQQSMMGNEAITIDRFCEAFYGNMNMLLLFVVPFFTMGLFTDELKKNTLVLLLTSPIRHIEIVLGKFFSGFSMVAIMLLLTLIFPVFLTLYSQGGNGPDLGVVFTTYLGLFLIGAFYVAIGLFWSSVSSTPLIAVMLTFATLFGFWLISFAAQSSAGTLQAILNQLAVVEQFNGLMKGIVEAKTLAFFFSGIGLALFLTHRSVESYSWRT